MRATAADTTRRVELDAEHGGAGANGHAQPGIEVLTEAQNARDFAKACGTDVRFNVHSEKFLVYHAGRYRDDETGVVVRRAKSFARGLWRMMEQPPQGAERKAVLKHCSSTESARGIGALLKLYQTEAGVPVTSARLDADPMLFNVLNGTIELRTGRLRDHRRADLLTKQSPVHYDPAAECPLWESCVTRWMNGNTALIGYLQRLAGLCLTGDVSVQELFFFYGGGANGKSVYLDTLTGLLGDYAGPAPDGLLTVRATPEHACEIADMLGMRLVVASETEHGARLRVQLVKKLTGDLYLKARFMRENYFTFARTHKLIIASNNKPAIRETSHAVWRRVRLVPWNVTIPEKERDERLLEKLREEWPGILAWAVAGCLDWQRGGMQTPDEVKLATENYRAEQDVLREFLAERCVTGPAMFVPRHAIYSAYTEWSKSIGDSHPLDRPAFCDQLRRVAGVDEGQKRVNGTPARGWTGIGLAADEYRRAEAAAGGRV